MAEIQGMDKTTPLRQVSARAIALITEYLGGYSAEMYEKFYAGKDDLIILQSVSELLAEVVGTKKAEELVKENFKNIPGLTV